MQSLQCQLPYYGMIMLLGPVSCQRHDVFFAHSTKVVKTLSECSTWYSPRFANRVFFVAIWGLHGRTSKTTPQHRKIASFRLPVCSLLTVRQAQRLAREWWQTDDQAVRC